MFLPLVREFSPPSLFLASGGGISTIWQDGFSSLSDPSCGDEGGVVRRHLPNFLSQAPDGGHEDDLVPNQKWICSSGFVVEVDGGVCCLTMLWVVATEVCRRLWGLARAWTLVGLVPSRRFSLGFPFDGGGGANLAVVVRVIWLTVVAGWTFTAAAGWSFLQALWNPSFVGLGFLMAWVGIWWTRLFSAHLKIKVLFYILFLVIIPLFYKGV
ncbi:hypothetical protein RchiOBHm_Chr7g0230771 [Rosa chinensis]|uniref:Uncharacterized protein n=1 Tax=Rosa chinensis TaxID=74649 RepID=A0A2P6PFJ3_ROSCH|nr:hypothetical protein RchiOBHm_Chr7g0230771 [Rosa chinensis]